MGKGGAAAAARVPRSDASPRPPLWATVVAVALLAARFRHDRPAQRGAARASGDTHARGGALAPPGGGFADWKQWLARSRRRIAQHRLTAIAAGVTYFSLLSLFPAIAALVSLYGLFADPTRVDDHLGLISGVVPAGGMEIIRAQTNRIAAQGGELGFAFAIGLALSLWSANAATKAMFDALNVVYGEKEKRGFVALNSLSLLFTVGGILILLLALGAVVVLPVVFAYVGFAGLWKMLVSLGRWPILALVVMLALALVYRFGACRTAPRWRWITWGSACATVAWLVVSVLFSWYAANFGSYDKTYGSLGAVIGFMTWMWISANVVLIGAAIDAEMERGAAGAGTTRAG